MKILCIKNNLSVDVESDMRQFLTWLKAKAKIEPTVEYRTSTIPNRYKSFGVFHGMNMWGLDGIKQKIRDTINPQKYDVIIYFYNASDFDFRNTLADWTYPGELNGAAFIEVATLPYWQSINWKWVSLCHEMVHALTRLLGFKGAFIQDDMDLYDGNNDPYNGTNYVRNLTRIIPHLHKLTMSQSKLIQAMIQVESQGNDYAIGDRLLKKKAYGCLQIRQPAVDDINRIFGTKYKAEQMLGNRALSIWCFERYMEIYATAKRLGRPVTDEDRARIWNGGPNGYKSLATVGYWKKVKAKL